MYVIKSYHPGGEIHRWHHRDQNHATLFSQQVFGQIKPYGTTFFVNHGTYNMSFDNLVFYNFVFDIET
jgi:hypothetical protein